MYKTTMRVCCLIVMVIASMAIVATQAGSLEPPPGPVAPTRPADTCFDNTGNRFVDCGDGTIKDTETGLYWLKDASCFSLGSWANANINAAELAHGQCGLTDGSLPGDWRLPTLGCPSGSSCLPADGTGEFASIFAPSCPTPWILDTEGTGCWSEGDPFSGVLSSSTWSATTYANNASLAYSAAFHTTSIVGLQKSGIIIDGGTWPVRSGP